MNADENKLTLDITGTFEIAIARNRLRQAASKYRLPLALQARAAAAITSIAELVLFQTETNNRQLKLVVFLHHDKEVQGIEFQFFAPLRNSINKHSPIAEWQLMQACDEFEISQHGSFDHLIMRLWARRKPS
jgi:hypothetical protein